MRRFFITLLVLSLFVSWNDPTNNPLKNTQWKGKVSAPDPVDGIFVFTADTTTLYIGGSPVEVSMYKVNGDTLKLVKVSGMSPCGSDTGYYKYNIKDSVLNISLQKDNCMERGYAFSADGYKSTHSSF